jgi:nucleotide-binding universal stress UspA family protein
VSDTSGPAILCYDGSQHAAEAIAVAGSLMPAAPAIVLTVWTPIRDAILAVSLGPTPAISDPADADARQRRAAENVAREGARRAKEAGLRAEPLTAKATERMWETIEEVAEERRARLIVCGTRRSGVISGLLDSVATALVNRASRPVMVVPSVHAAAERRRDQHSRRHPEKVR